MSEERAADLPSECERAPESSPGVKPDDLIAENEKLKDELSKLRREAAEREERASARLRLKELVGSESDPLFERALQKAEAQEELKHLPYAKRCELGYLLCLGEDRQKEKREGACPTAPPAFARSGAGAAPSLPMKKPTDFETARENARKYFGGR